jgi:RNA polymerase sigma factor (sigma-70 family)
MNLEDALVKFREDPKNAEAWETIVTGVYDFLLVHVASLLVSFRTATSESAYDIVHEVLLSFHLRWPKSDITLESEGALKSYLRSSCKNLLIDRYRHEKNSEKLIDYLSLTFNSAFPGEADVYRTIFINEILGLLPEGCAAMLKIYIEEGLTPAEMAEREGASPAAFYSRWYRCLEKAQKIILQKNVGLNR